MAEVIAMMFIVILLIASMTGLGFFRAGVKRKRLAARQARPLSGYELHRKRWLETGDPHELDLMNNSLED